MLRVSRSPWVNPPQKWRGLEWLYDCSWAEDKKIIGIQFVTRYYLYALIWQTSQS